MYFNVSFRRIIGFIMIALAVLLIPQPRKLPDSKAVTAIGDPGILMQRYREWKHKQPDFGRFDLALVPLQHHALARGSKHGQVTFQVQEARVVAQVYGFEKDMGLELWLANGVRIFSSEEFPETALRKIGRFEFRRSCAYLEADLKGVLDDGFKMDQVIVSPAGADPIRTGVLVASPSLFQRLYAAERLWENDNSPSIVKAAHATEATGFPDVFNDLVTEGEDLFFNEAFAGNGRTCGTCHPATNNFTIDPTFIATLPGNDPLFAAEFVPALIFGNPANLDGDGNPRRFENPSLMRSFGLIVENVDGMDDLQNRFTMRSVPHNIGLTVSVTTPPNDLTPPDDRTGWSGDGAPRGIVDGIAVSGRVRDFILGAIIQHYPKTMERSFTGANADFRSATPNELDALEAFLFSVGRQQELELQDGFANTLVLKDPEAEAGKLLFRDGTPPGSFTCNNCHSNAGANVSGGSNPGNRNFNTGVELFLQNRINDPNFTVVGEPRPVDGGFGTNPQGDFTTLTEQPGFVNENFGDLRFNTVSLVEAADTPPFFHSNVIDNLEDAIRFFNTPEFLAASGRSIPFNATQVNQVAAFLRVINAIDNVENAALRSAGRALVALGTDPNPDDVINRALEIAIADTQDAIDVLNQGGLHNSGGLPNNAVKQLNVAKTRFQQAMNTAANDNARINHIEKAQANLLNAVDLMRF